MLRQLLPATMYTMIASCFFTSHLLAADWTQFRGPAGAAVGQAENLPTQWDATKNIAWKTALPGLGTSSPITLNNRIYLTCYSGYAAQAESPGDMQKLMRHVVCLDRKTGKQIWSREFKPELPESEYRRGNDSWHGYSSSTPVTDGKHLYVFFGKSGVYCLDLEGKQVWRATVGSGTRGWGSASSLLLHKNLVIVNASVESQALIAFDKTTGKEVWGVSGIRGCWNSPIIVNLPGDKAELVISVPQKVLGFDPATGKELWDCDGIPDRGYVCPSVVAHEGVVYAIGGRSNTALAVRAGGKGNVTDSHLLWKTNKGSNVCSPVYYEGHLYWVHERSGTANCLDAKTGEVKFQQRLEPRPGIVYSSSIIADGKWFCVSQHNGTYVMDAKPAFKLLSHNAFSKESSRTNACPIVHNNQLLIRSDKFLYCIGN